MSMWKHLYTAGQGGLRFFCDEQARVAVADNSGWTPEETDDGVLWLDYRRKLTFDLDAATVQIPVTKVYGEVGSALIALVSIHCALDVSRVVGMGFEVHEPSTEVERLLCKSFNEFAVGPPTIVGENPSRDVN